MDSRTPIHDAMQHLEHPFDAFRRPHDQAATAGTENHAMPVLSDVKNIITALEANPLIAAIAETGIGTLLTPAEVTAVVRFIRDLEDAKRPQAAAPPQPVTLIHPATQQPTPTAP